MASCLSLATLFAILSDNVILPQCPATDRVQRRTSYIWYGTDYLAYIQWNRITYHWTEVYYIKRPFPPGYYIM